MLTVLAFAAAKWKIAFAVGPTASIAQILVAAEAIPTAGASPYIEGGLTLAIAGSYFAIVGALATGRLISAGVVRTIATEAAHAAIDERERRGR